MGKRRVRERNLMCRYAGWRGNRGTSTDTLCEASDDGIRVSMWGVSGPRYGKYPPSTVRNSNARRMVEGAGFGNLNFCGKVPVFFRALGGFGRVGQESGDVAEVKNGVVVLIC